MPLAVLPRGTTSSCYADFAVFVVCGGWYKQAESKQPLPYKQTLFNPQLRASAATPTLATGKDITAVL